MPNPGNPRFFVVIHSAAASPSWLPLGKSRLLVLDNSAAGPGRCTHTCGLGDLWIFRSGPGRSLWQGESRTRRNKNIGFACEILVGLPFRIRTSIRIALSDFPQPTLLQRFLKCAGPYSRLLSLRQEDTRAFLLLRRRGCSSWNASAVLPNGPISERGPPPFAVPNRF